MSWLTRLRGGSWPRVPAECHAHTATIDELASRLSDLQHVSTKLSREIREERDRTAQLRSLLAASHTEVDRLSRELLAAQAVWQTHVAGCVDAQRRAS